MIVLDTSALVSYFVASQPHHREVAAALEDEAPPLVVSPLVLAELDYLITARAGVAAEIAALTELASGAYEIAGFSADDLGASLGIVSRFADLGIGLTDASIVVLAERYRTRRILTLDRRHFAALRASRGEPFELLP